jgi:hypothetical protein
MPAELFTQAQTPQATPPLRQHPRELSRGHAATPSSGSSGRISGCRGRGAWNAAASRLAPGRNFVHLHPQPAMLYLTHGVCNVGQSERAGKMKHKAVTIALASLFAGAVQGQGYLYGSPGTTYNTIGTTTFGSNGTSYNQIGNTTFGSDGSSASRIGSSTSYSTGGYSTQIGNTLYNSDGTSVRRIGNTTFGSDGRSCTRIGNTTVCN